ncbi:MAG: protein jag [Terriglobales bacterium]
MDAEKQARLREFLDAVVRDGHFRLQFQFLTPPPAPGDEGPELVVDFSGQDANLLLADDGELLRSIEYLAFETIRVLPEEHHRILFDCQGRRQLRVEELRSLAHLAAERVRKNGLPYEFAPMNSRDRRTIHLALRDEPGLASESEGLGRDRHIVVRLPGSKPAAAAPGRKDYPRL